MRCCSYRNPQFQMLAMLAQVFLTPTHLGVVTEYAREGDLRGLLAGGRRLGEGKVRFLLQQLVSAVAYCHCEARGLFLLGRPWRICAAAYADFAASRRAPVQR